MHNVVMLSVWLSVTCVPFIMSVIMLNDVMLNVVMLNAVAPFRNSCPLTLKRQREYQDRDRRGVQKPTGEKS